MQTIADSFLADLENLDKDEENVEENTQEISSIKTDQEFLDFLEDIKLSTYQNISNENNEYIKINKCHKYIYKIDHEINILYQSIKSIYNIKFPELENIILSPLDYISVVSRIKNDVKILNLNDIITNTMNMAVTVALSMTTGRLLNNYELSQIVNQCDDANMLNNYKNAMLLYLETRMSLLAPNLCVIVGTSLAAKLILAAGGIKDLACMPSQNIMLLGLAKTTDWGSAKMSNISLIHECDIIMNTPKLYKNRAIRLVTGKASLAARVDFARQSTNGSEGIKLKNQILAGLAKAQELQNAPIKKALALPDDNPRTRRGGKRYRKMKEKYGMTDIQRQQKTIKFGPDAEEAYGLTQEIGFGVLSQTIAGGKIKVNTKINKIQLNKERQRQLSNGKLTSLHSKPTESGYTSIVNFTEGSGIELSKPLLIDKTNNKTNTYFTNKKFKKD